MQRLRTERHGSVGGVLDAEGYRHEVAVQGVRREREAGQHVDPAGLLYGPGQLPGAHRRVYGARRRLGLVCLWGDLRLGAPDIGAGYRLAEDAGCREGPDHERGSEPDET